MHVLHSSTSCNQKKTKQQNNKSQKVKEKAIYNPWTGTNLHPRGWPKRFSGRENPRRATRNSLKEGRRRRGNKAKLPIENF